MYLQTDMFAEDLKDTRTKKQRKTAKSKSAPQQLGMFKQREVAQFGVRANPKLPISPKTRLELMVEDRRSETEKVAATKKQIEDCMDKLL